MGEYSGYKRSLFITVVKTSGGEMVAGYPKTYPTATDYSNGYFTYNSTQYNIPSDVELMYMSENDYNNLVNVFKLYVESIENDPIDTYEINSNVEYDPNACSGDTPTTTTVEPTTTLEPVSSTTSEPTTTEEPVNTLFINIPVLEQSTTTVEPTTTTVINNVLFGVSQEHIIKSIDNGSNWSISYSGTPEQQFYGIHFINSSVGFALGVADGSKIGGVLKTIDGGDTWVDQAANLPSIVANNNIYCASKELSDFVYVGGSSGIILKYDVTGDTWYDVSISGTTWVQDIHGMTNDILVAVCEGDYNVIKTIDGGSNWTEPTISITNQILNSLAFNGGVGFIATTQGGTDSSRLYKSVDSGSTWSIESTTIFNGDSMLDISMPNSNAVFICGSDSGLTDGKFWSTLNTGVTWSNLSSNLGATVFGIWCSLFIDENIGWLGTNNGDILYTTNGGVTWNTNNTAFNQGIQDLCLAN